MKLTKKTYSLMTKEMLNIITSLLFLVLGAVKLFNPQTATGRMVVVVILAITLAVTCVAMVFRTMGKFDIVDEAAQEHYDRAKKKVFDFIWGFVCGVAVAMSFLSILVDLKALAVDITFTVNAWWLMILYGAMQMAISVHFIYLEKREA